MPRPGLPPTPASSTDINGKDETSAASFEASFTLPPPAISSAASNGSSSASVKSDSSYHPASPSSPVDKTPTSKRRRTLSMKQPEVEKMNSNFSLPPPPTRSRKIIQMKPGLANPSPIIPPTTTKGSGTSTPKGKKQPTSTSAAGKKIARKTAHSLIERRRRSKMNEEFGVLKDMIPACKDQEMHKLAILQASIDYLRYLEQCVKDLKAANGNTPTRKSPQFDMPVPRLPSATPHDPADESDEEEENDEDIETPQPAISPALTAFPSHTSLTSVHTCALQDSPRSAYASTTVSPAIFPERRHHKSSYSSTTSALPSPAFSAKPYQCATYDPARPTYVQSTEVSPAILPMADADHEATAALMMLNTDRRHESGKKRGMSVQDLLST